MSDTRMNVTPGWGPGDPRWPARWAGMTPKMQAREVGPRVGRRRRGHRFCSTCPTPTHVLAERDDRRRLAEALDEVAARSIDVGVKDSLRSLEVYFRECGTDTADLRALLDELMTPVQA